MIYPRLFRPRQCVGPNIKVMANLKKPTCINSTYLTLVMLKPQLSGKLPICLAFPLERQWGRWGLKTDSPPETSLLQGTLQSSFRPVLGTSHRCRQHLLHDSAGTALCVVLAASFRCNPAKSRLPLQHAPKDCPRWVKYSHFQEESLSSGLKIRQIQASCLLPSQGCTCFDIERGTAPWLI